MTKALRYPLEVFQLLLPFPRSILHGILCYLPKKPETSGNNLSDTDLVLSSDKAVANCYFKSYASDISHFPDRHFDLVIVDGRARPSCIWQSLAKVKPGGYLLVDNTKRDWYLSKTMAAIEKNFETVLDEFTPSPYNV